MVFAAPLYIYLSRRKTIGIFSALAWGFILGCMADAVPFLCEVLSTMQNYSSRYKCLAHLLAMGGLGAGIGLIFWLIAHLPLRCGCKSKPMGAV